MKSNESNLGWIIDNQAESGHSEDMPTKRTAKNAFERCGIDVSEYADAVAEAMRVGGASEQEIREALVAVHVDEAMPDDGEWYLIRRER